MLPDWSTLPAPARRLLRALPWLLVTGLSLALLWPVPRGVMPLSADHTVHLTRIWMWAEQLGSGSVRGWDTTWFFGTPVGELYPVLGDLVIVLIRALSLGTLDWPQAYAIGFCVVFTAQGWALLRVGKATGLGPVPGLVAALLVLADVGAYREGGWTYTVFYGVWPQALSTALTWLSLGELCRAVTTDDPTIRRRTIATASLAMGAALLAHPMAMLSVAIGGPLLVLTLGVGSRAALRNAVAVGLLYAALGIAVAAWWLVPMLLHRGWMASYGWMWLPLSKMIDMASQGQWVQAMPTAVGTTVSLGLVLTAIAGSRPARFFAAFALLCWLLASRDTLWALRLDLLSEGFTHLQYQRFLITAKPGFFLVAGIAVGRIFGWAAAAWRTLPPARGRPVAAALTATAIGLCGWMAVDQRKAAQAKSVLGHVGKIQLDRVDGQPEFDADYAALLSWLRGQSDDARTHGYRTTVLAPRNLHWFMDAPVYAGLPLYKQGFTPGDNFVHKPESGSAAVLDAARVRYVITTGRRGSRSMTEVARFGRIRVLERPNWDQLSIAWTDGPGEVEVLEDDPDAGTIRVRVSDAGEGTRLVFGVGGFIRWHLVDDSDAAIPWFEVPVTGEGPIATIADRRGGALRGGKAHGDDGSEPTLLAADVTDGEYTLRYHASTGLDLLAGLLSLVALGLCIALLWRPATFERPTHWVDLVRRRVGPLGHPALVAGALALVVVFAIVRHSRGTTAERGQAFGWLDNGHATAPKMRADFLKTDMLIRPAVVLDRGAKGPTSIVFERVAVGEVLYGWVAIDDDAAKNKRRGRHRLHVEAVTPTGGSTMVHSSIVAHRPGRRLLEIDTAAFTGQTIDLRVTVESDGKAPPPIGFDFDLGAPP